MGDVTFNKGKWRDIKKAEFRKSLKNSMLGKHDKIVDKICDWHSSILDEVLSTKDIDTIEKAEKELKNIKYAKAFFIFSGATLFIFDSVNNIVEYKNLPVDTTGSSIDDGNKNLYIDIPNKNDLLFIAKSIGGDILSLVTRLKILKFLDKIGDYAMGVKDAIEEVADINLNRFGISQVFLENHRITIDYKDINSNTTQERKYILYKANPIFDKALGSAWDKISADMQTLDRVIFTRDEAPVEFIYHKKYKNKDDGELNTFEFRQGRDESKIISVLKRISYINDKNGDIVHIAKDGTPQKLIVNYYANYGAGASNIYDDLRIDPISDKLKAIKYSAQYCLKELKGYALDEGFSSVSEYDDLNIYSNKHKDSRLEFFKAVIRDKIAEISHTKKDKRYNTYTDTKTNTFLWNTNGTFAPAKKIVFVDGKYSSSASGKYDIFGYSNPDTINLTKNADNVYAELGLGSDTITTGSGDDTIYTNANIDDEFDNETSSTVNTVNSGAGDDTIYGSKGKDIITTKKGTNHIYTKSGDDEVNVEDGKNYIYLGSGSDKVNTNNGTNYIYTGINNTNENDQDTKDDINTINLTYGKNEVYGSKGMDLITSKNATKNYIVTKEGDDAIDIYGGEFNEIYTGKGSDTITINSAKGPNYIYTSTDSKNSEDQDTKDDINTVVITTGQNYIYGGKGVENLHILEGINNANLGNGKNTVDIKNGTNIVVISRI